MKKFFVILALILCNVCLCFAQTVITATLTTNVKTPYGATVPDTRIITEIPANASDIAAAHHLVNMYGGEYLGNPTWTYNCHSYAWHISEGGMPVAWIGWSTSTAHHIYWHPTNGGYVAVNENVATKVDYPLLCNHSAVRESQYVYVSKWGQGPLVRHAPYALPTQFNPQHYILQGLNPGTFGFYARAVTISGPNVVGCTPTTFTIQPQSGTVSWVVTSGLNIIYQNQTTLTVIAGSGSTATITARLNGIDVAQKTVTLAGSTVRDVTFIEALSPSTYAGGTINFRTHPYPPLPNENFEWRVTPSSNTDMSVNGNYCDVTFYSSGDYYIEARVYDACYTGTWVGRTVTVY